VKKRRKKKLGPKIGNALREYPPALLHQTSFSTLASNASFCRPKCSAQYLVIFYFASTYAVHHVSLKKRKKHKPEQHEKHPDRNYLGSAMPLCQNALVLDLLLCPYDIY
jgi:hypothetical protein